MRGTTRTVAVAAMTAVALLAAGCGGGDSDDTETTAAGKTGGEYTIRGCNPQNSLVPGNTGEVCGANVLDAVFSKLVQYDPLTAKPSNDVAESIETTDNQNFTIKIKQGTKFHDGTEVKAKNFVDAWNYTAYAPNAQYTGYFFEPVEGYGDTQCTGKNETDPCIDGPPKTDKMSGLVVVDDTTFTIKTSAKVSNLPVRLGYLAFAPLPDSFYADPKAFGEKPVGNGPYKLDSWTKDQSFVLSKNAEYTGDFAGNADKITFKIYQDGDAAYNDVLANNLDITDQIPTSAMIDDKFKSDLPDRNQQMPVGVIQNINFPPADIDPDYADIRIRQAISMAIDRPAIIKQIFNNSRVPATGWVPPVIDGYKAGACGEWCTFDAAKAKAKLAEAGGFKGDKFRLTYNANGDHQAWAEAACNSIKQSLGIDCVAESVTDFGAMRNLILERKLVGMFRAGWQMDYPSIENFLSPIYRTGATSNDGEYSNPAFDKLLDEAAAAPDAAAANAKYQEAELILGQDLPSIPTWYGTATIGWSENVTGVQTTAFGTIDLASVSVK